MKPAIVLLALLAGCSSPGIHMSDDEARACRTHPEGCSVWTEDELAMLARRAFMEGYQQGKLAEKRSL